MPLYSDKVMDHFSNPRNMGEIKELNGIGRVGNVICGDVMNLYIKVEDEKIVDAKFKTLGCGAAIATSSMVTEMVKGKSIDEALEISNRAVAEALDGLPPQKLHCSVLAEEALQAAIKDYFARKEGAKMARDLVCKMDIVEEKALKTEYQGKAYYFCSQMCKERFEAEPEKFLSKENSRGGVN